MRNGEESVRASASAARAVFARVESVCGMDVGLAARAVLVGLPVARHWYQLASWLGDWVGVIRYGALYYVVSEVR